MHLLVAAELDVGHAVNLGDLYRDLRLLDVLGEGLPGGCQPLAPDAPGCIERDECEFVALQILVEGVCSERHRVLAVLQQDLQGPVVLVVENAPFLPVPALEVPAPARLVQVPLLDVLAHVHTVGPEDIEHVHDGVAAGEVEHGDVEIYLNLVGEEGRRQDSSTKLALCVSHMHMSTKPTSCFVMHIATRTGERQGSRGEVCARTS